MKNRRKMPEVGLNELTSQLLTFALFVSPFVLLISYCLFQKFSLMKTPIFWSLHNSPGSQTSFLNPTLTFILTSLAGLLRYSAGHLILRIRSVCVCLFCFFFFLTEINISVLTFKMSWTTQQIVFIIPKQNTVLSPFWLCALLFYYLLWFYTVRNI